jgi:SMODS and SLOG-associating 2TM effector domain family 4
MTNTESLNVLEAQIRECFGRVIYTHKTHSKMADSCAGTLRHFKIAQILLSSLTASGTVGVVFRDELWLKIATAILSLLTVAVSAYMKGFDPGATAQKHRDAAADIWPIRESYLSLLTDIAAGDIEAGTVRHQRDQLQEKLAAIYRGAPHTTGDAYAQAQVALKENEEYTFSDTEIDKFLPKQLRHIGVASAGDRKLDVRGG